MALKLQDPPELNISQADLLRMVGEALDCGGRYGVFGQLIPCEIRATEDSTFTILFDYAPTMEPVK